MPLFTLHGKHNSADPISSVTAKPKAIMRAGDCLFINLFIVLLVPKNPPASFRRIFAVLFSVSENFSVLKSAKEHHN